MAMARASSSDGIEEARAVFCVPLLVLFSFERAGFEVLAPMVLLESEKKRAESARKKRTKKPLFVSILSRRASLALPRSKKKI